MTEQQASQIGELEDILEGNIDINEQGKFVISGRLGDLYWNTAIEQYEVMTNDSIMSLDAFYATIDSDDSEEHY